MTPAQVRAEIESTYRVVELKRQMAKRLTEEADYLVTHAEALARQLPDVGAVKAVTE